MRVKAVAQCPYCGTQEFDFNFGLLDCPKCGEKLSIDTVELKVIELKEVCVMTHGEEE